MRYYRGVLEMYRKNKSKYLQTIIYEDIQANPEEVLRKLFNVLEIPSYHVSLAMEALKVWESIIWKN